ncbi:MAG: hypothetical protein HKN04_08515 [Rhodothermaceae bacterium]|nr:hypothetical protein [Rhodothermaceae bacterium]
MLVRLAFALLLFASFDARAQETAIPALGNRGVAFVAEVPGYRFHSDFWLNLYDYLYGLVGGGPGDYRLDEEGSACLAARPTEQARGWQEAVAFYRADLAERHHRRDPVLRSVRHRLAVIAAEHDPNAEVEAVIDLLHGAAPAYRACLWDAHDARNRERISDLIGSLVRFGPGLTEILGRLYQAGWPDVVVDVTSYASGAGANTTSGLGETPHMMLSSLDPDIAGYSGLELTLHEASHAIFGGRFGEITEALDAAANALGVELPWQIWHAVSFHTSGWAVQQVAAAEGVAYEPYWFRNNVFLDYHEAVATHWQPYLEGNATMDAAALALIRALAEP